MLCCLVTTSSIMRSTRKETQQQSLFDLFQRAMGAKDQFFKPRMATDFDKAGSITKTAVISFPQKTPYLDTDFINPFSTFSEINRTSLRKEGLSLNVVVSNLLWFNEWHQRISSYYLHGLLGHPLEKIIFSHEAKTFKANIC